MKTTGSSTVEVSPLMAELKQETSELHTRAERHPVQASLIRGQADRSVYVAYLSQLWHLHCALEGELASRVGSATLAPVTPEQFRADLALEDLAALGAPGAEAAVPLMAGLSAELALATDAELLGMQYVLEGSTNGGRYIASAVRRGLGREGDQGVRYLDPYGDEQRARWGAFCGAVGRLGLSPGERAEAVAGAKRMFGLIIGMFDQMQDGAAAGA